MSGANVAAEAWQLWALAVAAKVCLVLACAALVTRLMRERAAAERHLVWVVAVAAVLALPVLALIVPPQRVRLPGLLPRPAAGGSAVPAPPAATSAPASTIVPAAPARTPGPAPALPAATRSSAPAVRTLPPTPVSDLPTPAAASLRPPFAPETDAAPPPPIPPTAPARRAASDLLVLVWLAGVGGIGGVTVLGIARVGVYARRARSLRDRQLVARAYRIAAEFGVSCRRLRLLEGAADAMPLTFGIVRPTLLLPSTAQTWTPARQETVLRHELGHIRRRDSLTQLAAELACALHWFNPLVWLAARRLYVEREHACDDLVLVCGARASDYAAELLDIARTMRVRRGVPLAAIALARRSQLRLRVAALLEERPRRATLSGRLLVPSWIGAFALVLPLSALAPSLRTRVAQPRPAPAAALHVAAHALSESGSAFSPRPLVPQVSVGPLYMGGPALLTGWFVPQEQQLSSSQVDRLPQQDCLSRTRNRTTNHSRSDRRTTMKWSGDGCSGEVEIEGEVEFDRDFTTITGLSRDGSLRLDVEEGRDERQLVIRPANGALSYEYWINGRRVDFDAAGQRWLSSTLLFLFRNLGLVAEQRASAILERRGAEALLTEVGLVSGDYVRAKYLAVLVERGRLDERSLRRVLELAGNTLESDYFRTQVITAVAGRYEFTDAVRQAYIEAASRMSSDHYRHQAFATVLQRGNLTAEQISAVLREAKRISSDHYRAELLRTMRDGYSMTPEIRTAYLEAAAAMSSDHYKARVLGGVLDEGLTPAEVARVVEAVASISSDHYRAELLANLEPTTLREPAIQLAFVRAASGISSDHYKQRVLLRAAARSDLERDALLGILDAAATIDGDYYLASLLVDIAQRHRLTGEARERFLKALDTISSEHYRGNVASALLRQERSLNL